MPRIAIPKVRDDRKPVEYRIKLAPEVDDQLQLYCRLYTQTYGQQVEARDLLEPIVRRFLENDRGFKRFKRQQAQSQAPSKPTTATTAKTGQTDGAATKKP